MTEQAVEYTDEQLYEYIKTLPEFSNLPLPKSWYDKFDIKVPNPPNYRDYLESNYAIKCSTERKDLPPLTLKTPDDYTFKELVKEEIQLELVSKEIEPPNKVEVLPIIIE